MGKLHTLSTGNCPPLKLFPKLSRRLLDRKVYQMSQALNDNKYKKLQVIMLVFQANSLQDFPFLEIRSFIKVKVKLSL
jgi:hypothetical protein